LEDITTIYDQYKNVDALETLVLTGEDIYLLKYFKPVDHRRGYCSSDLAFGGLLKQKELVTMQKMDCDGYAPGRHTGFIYGLRSLCSSHSKFSGIRTSFC
jgi:hypothetical protein